MLTGASSCRIKDEEWSLHPALPHTLTKDENLLIDMKDCVIRSPYFIYVKADTVEFLRVWVLFWQVKRQIIFRNTKQTIVQLLSDLDLSPNSSFEREVFCEEEDSFLLSSENMKSLKHYHDQVFNASMSGISCWHDQIFNGFIITYFNASIFRYLILLWSDV